ALAQELPHHRRLRARRAAPQQQGRLLVRGLDARDDAPRERSALRRPGRRIRAHGRRRRRVTLVKGRPPSADGPPIALEATCFPSARQLHLARSPMQIQVARISPVVIELAVEVPADAVKAEVEKAYTTLQKRAHVKGFRPGKAPRQVLAHLYGPQVASDVVNAIVNETLPKALSEKQVQPVNQPQVEAGKFEQGAAVSYKARFEVSPEIRQVASEGTA